MAPDPVPYPEVQALRDRLEQVTAERDRLALAVMEEIERRKAEAVKGPAPWLSARWLLTLICGGVFAWVSIAGLLPGEAMVSVLSSVFAFYFLRPDRGQGKSA